MPAPSYLVRDGKYNKEVLAGTTGGSVDANKIVAYDATGKIPAAALPAGYGADTDSLLASEQLAAGAWVNIYDSGSGVMKVRNAIASGVGFEAAGYVKAATASGVAATISFDDNNDAVTGLTPGDQFLSATVPGGSQPTSPTGAGVLSQYLGKAISPTIVHAAIERPTILAQ